MATDTHVSLSRPALEQAYLTQQEQLAARERELDDLRKQLASLEELQSRTEMKYDLECASRDELVERAVEARMGQALEKYADVRAELEKKKVELRQWAEKTVEETARKMEEARREALHTGIMMIARQSELLTEALVSKLQGRMLDYQEKIAQFYKAAEETRSVMKQELLDALKKAREYGKSRSRIVGEMVRMLSLSPKSEKMQATDEEYEALLAAAKQYASLPQEKKDALEAADDYLRERRREQRRLEQIERERKGGHGRNVIPEHLPRLETKYVWPEGYKGHEDEYRILSMDDVKEFIVPNMSKLLVLPVCRPIIVRKDDVFNHPIQAPCVEGPIWKSYASSELLAQIEYNKYWLHMPFYRQIKDMKNEGLELARSTINDWHEDVAEMLYPLYRLQKQEVMKSELLAADGSPMPVVNNEKHKTVKQYIIEFRSIETGIPVFMTVCNEGSGRSRKVIEADLKEWHGRALLCDAYSGYDWVKEEGRILCRCSAHARRKFEHAKIEDKDKSLLFLSVFGQISGIEKFIKADGLKGSEIVDRRRRLAKPYWEELWLMSVRALAEEPKDTLIYKAANHLVAHYDELTQYIDIAEMPMDNNDTERSIRDMVMGKNAYLFCETPEACSYAAEMYTFFGACKVLGKNPKKWLAYVLDHIRDTKPQDMHKLLPSEWVEC